jgi:mannitol/fructose-specific phosphotransferase system IIA component (Ntr-type)
MTLTASDLATLFDVSESRIYRWAGAEDLPATEVGGEKFFNPTEVLEWATVRRAPFSPALFPTVDRPASELSDALERGGITHPLTALDWSAASSAMAEHILADVPPVVTVDDLARLIEVRGSDGISFVGDQIATPNPQHPMILPIREPRLMLARLGSPVPLGKKCPQGHSVHALFLLVSPTIQDHLRLLAKLACALRDESLRGAITDRESAGQIQDRVRRAEEAFARPAPLGSATSIAGQH